jgi:hypothetical protein
LFGQDICVSRVIHITLRVETVSTLNVICITLKTHIFCPNNYCNAHYSNEHIHPVPTLNVMCITLKTHISCPNNYCNTYYSKEHIHWRVEFCEERSKYETYPWQSRKINHGTTHTILFPERICTTKIWICLVNERHHCQSLE